MKIDIHRHKANTTRSLALRNLYHYEEDKINDKEIFSAGIHPWHLNRASLMRDLESVRRMVEHDSVLALGETGLDKSKSIPLDLQTLSFKEHIEISIKWNKPMIIHCVKAYHEIFAFRKKVKASQPWIIHWFNASLQMGKQLIDHGFYLSFGHMLFNERSKAFRAYPDIPLEKIFFETDDSAYSIHEIYERAAELRSIKIKDLEQQIETNFENCFGK